MTKMSRILASRREFLASASAAATSAIVAAMPASAAPTIRRPAAAGFGLNPIIEANPKAVFIRRTNVPHKMAAAEKLQEGLTLARQVFVPKERGGVPVTHKIVLKPNNTNVRGPRPDSDYWGTGTDPDFYEGVLIGLKELGLRRFYSPEANNYQGWNYRGVMDIHLRHGVEMNDPEVRLDVKRRNDDVVWTKVPEAVVYDRIPHYAPVGEPDTWLLNIAKWKGHSMCLTQTVKSEQGLVVWPYVQFCPGWAMVTGAPDYMKPNICTTVEDRVNRYFENHKRNGFARYAAPGDRSVPPMAQEIWAHKTCDNMSVLKTGLAMIEGIYGRDGDGFGQGNDYLTNMVMFSKDKFRLDIIGLWLGGHEPGNVHLYRIAKERGLTDTFNPWDVPIFEWKDGKAEPRKLTDFTRTPLKSPYLPLAGEQTYHLTNEQFDYDRYKI
jgi:hypothetical protein